MSTYSKPSVLPAWGESNTTPADMVQPSSGALQAGWPLSATAPARQTWNWLMNFCANAIRYFMQRGLVDYDAAETYQLNARIIGDDGNTYVSIQNANTGHTPSTAPTWWTPWGFTMAQIAAAGPIVPAPTYITASGNYTVPVGCRALRVRMVGGGGGGAGSGATAGGGCGGAGGYAEGIISPAPGTVIAVTVGAGGAGGGANANGSNGSASSFGAYATANGGGAGIVTASSPGGAGGTAAGAGFFTASGGYGSDGNAGAITPSFGAGGSSAFGGGGRAGNSAGAPAEAPGSGGGGCYGSAGSGTAGAPGVVIVEAF